MISKIPFNKPAHTGLEDAYVSESLSSEKMSGDGHFGLMCQEWFQKKLSSKGNFLVPSGTHALELAALLVDIQPGDEVIMPSYTFVSTANAFVLRGAKIVFVDLRPDTMNINEDLIANAITERTRVIVPVHYAGVICEMNKIMELANKYNLVVIEDAAQAINSTFHGKYAGTFGHMAAFSFHETKNITSGGEGGLLVINDVRFLERSEIIREKGTNRKKYFRGLVDKYTWVDIGSSYLMNEISSAYLWGQIQNLEKINGARKNMQKRYLDFFGEYLSAYDLEIMKIPDYCMDNGHMFYFKLKNTEERTLLINYLQENNIQAVFHYVPLHSSIYGISHTRFSNEDIYTTKLSERLLRLPMYYSLTVDEQDRVNQKLIDFFTKIK